VPAEVADVRVGTFVDKGVPFLADVFSTEPLVAVGWDGRPLNRLADSATVSSDGASITVTLKPNVSFHSGEALTAERVGELLMSKPGLSDQLTGVETPDQRTLVLSLKRAHSLKPVDLSEYTVDDNTRPQLRTGPFRITSLGTTAVLEPFEGYDLGPPVVRRVEILKYPSHRAAWSAMMRGEVNFLHEVNREAIEFIAAGGHIQAYPMLRPYVIPLVFSQRHPILRRREVRVAISEAIDRDEILEKGMRRHGEVAEGPFWPHHWAYAPGRHNVAYNPEAAKLRLDAAGLPVRRRGAAAMPARFEFTCVVAEGDVRFERIALVVQRQLSQIGIDMRLEVVPAGTLFPRLGAGRFEAFIYEMASGRTLGFPHRFWHSPGPTGYAAADEALDRMKFARTDEEVRVAISDVMRIMRADPPAVFLVWPREARAADKSFAIPYEKDRDIFGTFWQLRRAGTDVAAR
jgi:peptide/nickel transport system substrate-binding protein